MRIPIEWLNEYVDLKGKSVKEVADALTVIGLMQDKIEMDPDVIEVEQRLNRVDLLSIYGIARDLAAYFDLPLKKLETYTSEAEAENIIKIDVKCPTKVRRFNTRVFKNITVKPSPDWLKNRLEAYGIPSINNVVDITNYVMVELGQPMHAQDLAKMSAPEIVFRDSKPGEKITTLLGEKIELVDGAFVATQGDKPTVIGGIVGGVTTGVTESTTDIILDAGNYDQTTIRAVSRKLKIMNETVQRYDKYLHPNLTQLAIERASKLILDICGGEYHNNFNYYPEKYKLIELTLRLTRLNSVSGMQFTAEDVEKILGALEYTLEKVEPKVWKVAVPVHRTDVEVEDDLVSDILRINDYNKIPVSAVNSTPPAEITPAIYKFENRIRDELVRLGLDEHRTDPLVPSREKDSVQIKLLNALTSEKSALRVNVFETLQQVVETYKKFGATEIGVFEIGLGFTLDGSKENLESYKETLQVECFYENSNLSISQSNTKLKALLGAILKHVGLQAFYINKDNEILINENVLGIIYNNRFTLLLSEVLKYSIFPDHEQRVLTTVEHNTKFDISIIVEADEAFGPMYKEIRDMDNILNVEVVEEYTGDNIPEGKRAILVEIETIESDPTMARKKVLDHLMQRFNVTHRN